MSFYKHSNSFFAQQRVYDQMNGVTGDRFKPSSPRNMRPEPQEAPVTGLNILPKLEVGQVWKEVDPRKERFVLIVSLAGGWAQLVTVERGPTKMHFSTWTRVKGTRRNHAAVERFDGKRSGYDYVTIDHDFLEHGQ